MGEREACPPCGSRRYKRNGRIHTGKQNHKCKTCGRACVLVPENHVITEEQGALIERLLLERISLRRICRAVGVGLRWLLHFMVARFATAPDHLYVQPTAGTQKVILHRLEAEVDELWSFVGKRKIKIQTYMTEVVARDIKPLGLAAIASERVAA